MFDIEIKFDDINIASVQKEDITSLQEWINLQQTSYADRPLKRKELSERFLEYYVSEGEFFLKIKQKDNLIGILKGRIEFKNPNEVWMWFFVIDSKIRSKGIGSRVLLEIEKYFINFYGIFDFFTAVADKDTKEIKFWEKNNYKLIRVSKDFFNVDDNYMDMLILKKENIN